MVFNAAVNNDHDHPSNHALLRREKSWRLAPAYDLLPTAVLSRDRGDLALTIGNQGCTASIYSLLTQAGRFGWSAEAARAQIARIAELFRDWRESIFSCGMSAKDIDIIAPAIVPDCLVIDREGRRNGFPVRAEHQARIDALAEQGRVAMAPFEQC